MQTLATITTVFAFVAIAIHVYIWIIESFLWTKPKGRETFGMTEEFAESTKEMAANQRSVQHGPLVLVSEPRKFHTPTIDRDRMMQLTE